MPPPERRSSPSVHDGLFVQAPQAEGGAGYARVVPERSVDHARGLTYRIPTTLAELLPGERVRVPLGRGNHLADAIVVEIITSADLDPARIKPIAERTGHRLPPTLISLARWMAAYDCCPIGMVVSTMLPAAVKKRTGRRTGKALRRSGVAPPDKLPPATRRAWEQITQIGEEKFPIEIKELAGAIGLKSVAPLRRLITLGLLSEVVVESVHTRGESELDLAGPAEPVEPPVLTGEQAHAVASVVGSLGRFEPFLLYGVTGSGKTEVYLRVLEAVLARGQSGIVLVPEISLTPQTARRFTGRFGREQVAVLHSGLTASQRHAEWERVASGRARLVVGARSAVFAPFDPEKAPLGIIVVDEEHDGSYKQDSLPRYHARSVALRRAQLESCPVLLGSATPSLESWHNATTRDEAGGTRFRLLELSERVGGGRLPRVEIVDMLQERRERVGDARAQHALGPRLEHGLGETLASGGQAILLLNRRGFANYLHCPASGWTLKCDHCDATMVVHRHQVHAAGRIGGGSGFVRCHHCLAERVLPRACPESGEALVLLGFGTQRLEEELEGKFPELVEGETMLRLDADTMRKGSDYFRALDRFARGEVRVLLGTQMIAKGLDFPNVQLIGVVNGDTAMHLPDFRASERTFQLVSQVAGRAGRSEASSRAKVIVQTWNPQDPALLCAASHDYRAFAAQELESRCRSGLPPSKRMARVVVRDRDPAKAERSAREIFHAARAHAERAVRVCTASPCPISRIGDHYRWSVDFIGDTPGAIQRVLTALRNDGLVKSDATTAVDVDPISLL